MIRIQLWRLNRLVQQQDAEDEKHAARQLDAMLTEIHNGKHGSGTFQVDADQVDKHGCFEKSIFHSTAVVPANVKPS